MLGGMSPAEAQHLDVQEALERLLERDDWDAFLILQAGDDRTYLQLALDDGELVLDFPIEFVDEEVADAAHAWFGERGVELCEVDEEGDPMSVYRLGLGTDTDAAAGVVVRLFRELFDVDEHAEITAVEN